MRILTIGGYGFTEQEFIRSLQNSGVDTFVDVRQRRGVRGARYAFLNSNRLQAALRQANIRYVHAAELAPTSDIRTVQKLDDQSSAIAKRDRRELSSEFIDKYQNNILKKLDWHKLRLTIGKSKCIALFCVETQPSACHRHLAASHLKDAFSIEVPVEHLKP